MVKGSPPFNNSDRCARALAVMASLRQTAFRLRAVWRICRRPPAEPQNGFTVVHGDHDVFSPFRIIFQFFRAPQAIDVRILDVERGRHFPMMELLKT